MKATTTKAFKVFGGAMALTTMMAVPVKAEDMKPVVTNDTVTILESSAWEDKAAANVKTCANIREAADVESGKVGILPRGSVAEILEIADGWTRVKSGSVEGYIKDELLVYGEEAKNLYDEVHKITATVQASALRVRQNPSLEAEQIGSMAQGSSVSVKKNQGDWYEVSYQNQTAYMAAEYLTLDEVDETALSMAEYEEQLRKEEERQKEEKAKQAQAAKNTANPDTAKTASAAASVGGGELDILAAIIECEAGGESHTGKVAVGAVVMNRVASGKFPNSISAVVQQRGQFSPVASGKFSSVLARGARQDCYQAAREAIGGSNPVGNALYFNSGKGKGQQIGNQHFY